jgi:hypothetical protein
VGAATGSLTEPGQAWLGVKFDLTVLVEDEAAGYVEAETDSLSLWLDGEEGIEDAVADLGETPRPSSRMRTTTYWGPGCLPPR